ncbi:3'-5' exoribonuclease HELZ2-like [Ptychodera flava]|uniref:3'-5' exoribonuclease HELZ2-like n=1 Tax=Ptychodera flava TaxID=63121 RepID=UPI00396A0D06
MHRLLNMEELSQLKILEMMNCKTVIKGLKSISPDSTKGTTTLYAPNGELYGEVELNQELSDDYAAGRILLRSVNTVLVKPCNSAAEVVYEAKVVSNEDFTGIDKHTVFIQLSKQFCEALGLHDQKEIEVEIQFRINRLPFCRQHYAVDLLTEEKLQCIFPHFRRMEEEIKQKLKKVPGLKMNSNQLKAVTSITGKNGDIKKPLIIYGPFGTGKTYTMAMSIKQLVTKQPDAKVLLCTISNSAADLYITEYFDRMVREGCEQIKPLRIYAGNRRFETIQEVVAKYCPHQEVKAGIRQVRMPNAEDVQEVKEYSVIVTTLTTSVVLQRIGLEGHFTHIFIDEAGQALETEAIMPITLARLNTKVVLAGDHQQMSPEVHSDHARKLKFDQSLLTRLFKAYIKEGSSSQPFRIMLDENYRCQENILKFISLLFYGKALIASSDPPQKRHPEIYPLAFYSASGEERIIGTSYYNTAEVLELAHRIESLCRNWPKEWGKKDLSTIGVISPYSSQVQQIRSSLRQRGLGKISVEHVLNVQGKEFRAVYISTVRTSKAVDTGESDVESLNLGFLSDKKLLNTALTRAQSLVAVVGDPIALCAIGKCSNNWRSFISECEKNQSIHPDTLTIESIEQQVLSEHRQLNPQAAEFIPLKKVKSQPAEHSEGKNGTTKNGAVKALYSQVSKVTDPVSLPPSHVSHNQERHSRCSSPWRSDEKRRETKATQGPEDNKLKNRQQTTVTDAERRLFNDNEGSYDEWESDDEEDVLESLDIDEILQELARQLDETRRKYSEGRAFEDVADSDEEVAPAERNTTIRNREGMSYRHNFKSGNRITSRQQRRIGADHDEDYDSDSDDYVWNPYENETLETDETTLIKEYSPEDLKEKISSEPQVYKRCKLYVDPTRTYAVTLDETEDQEIEITTKLKRGRALNNDEVVVEILNCASDFPDGDERKEKTYGTVVGILERAVDPRLQKIACIIDEHSPNLMSPINRNLPKMIWIQPRDDTKSRSPNIIPICTMTKGGDLKIKRHEKVTNKDRPNKVFLVRFLRWHPQYRYPICVVIDVLPYGDTLATGTAILKSEYGVKATYKTATKRELARMYPDKWSIPSSEYQNRKNLQHLDVFTVDPAESTDLDDALSVERLSHNKYRVGIHIADVSFFVHPSSELDKEAFRRATSHYPWKQNPIHMLPPQLSTKLCSLIPGKDRLALTLFLTMTEDAEISDQNICRSIIRSRSKLSYEDAEKAINGDQGTMAITDSIKESIDILHGLTCKLQAQRLGDGRFCCNYENHDVATSPQAHSMVEELMLQANMQVASLLVEVFPHCTPLRRQKPPRDEKLAEWKKKHGHQISNSLDIATKSDLLQLQEYFKPGLGADVDVLNTVWEQVVGAVQVDDLAELKKIILDDQNHPQLAVMSSDYRKIQERSIYTSSKNISEERSHFSLNVSEYTHFTSPIRRYIDIVVHRLVIAYLTEQAPPYSETNITEICKNCNQQALFAKEFERAMMALHIATTLKEKPVRSLAFIDSTSDGDIHLQVPEYNIHIPSSQRVVKFNTLQPCEQPNIDEENTPVTLKWKARIYERRADEDVQMGLPPVRRIATAVLPPDRFVKHVPGSLWQEMMACLINNKRPNLRTVLHRISIILNNPMTGFPLGFGNQLTYCTEVTSEGIGPDNLGDSKHFCQYERTYACGEVVEVQLSTKIKKGTLTPYVQLFNLTPKLDVCIEHRGDPIHCFAEVANERTAILRNKRSITEYQRIWRKLIAMSAAHSAVTAGENVTIHTVGIQWSKCDDRDDTYEGLFRLPTEFCMNRHIKFNGARIENKSMNKHYDFVCVRYRMTDSDQTYKKSSDEVSDRPNGFCWVSHCVTTAAERYDDFVEVHILINQTRTQFPDRLLHQRPSKLLPCTIEWIPQTMPDRRVKEAMERLKNASKFIQDICLGRKISMDDSKIALTVSDTEIKSPRRPFYKLNPVQDQAVKTALFKPFTLIQGPPGTGKTVTGVHIANWFVYLNGQVRLFDHRQVMYCGPSNKSVDVVTAYLKKIAHIKIVRVYSESIERQYFPVPGMPEYPLRSRGGEVTMSEEHKDVALHFLIRQSTNPFHQQIKNFDKIFRDPGYSYNREDEMNYRGLVKEAEKIVLQQSDVILCTCVTAGARRIAEGTRIQQCIIDECGMCTEPETIVPLVTTEPKQVVLIGDHKQLRPIVTEEMSKKLGMEISVLERYEKKAMMLTMQYRMHPGICRFPSEHFYDGKLETAAQVLHRPRGLNIWPGGEQNPTVFCHIVGTEERLTVSTSEGSEQSRSNLDEVEQVVRMAITLVVRHFVNPASIIILSQYRAQCSEITKRLEAKGHANIAVNTVIVSQGSEWDYVIFSTVRSLPKVEIEEKPSQGWLRSNLGFITDEHQINVAITRAKRGLIIVGNRELLGTHGMWKNLLRKYEQDRCLVQAKDFLQLPMR